MECGSPQNQPSEYLCCLGPWPLQLLLCAPTANAIIDHCQWPLSFSIRCCRPSPYRNILHSPCFQFQIEVSVTHLSPNHREGWESTYLTLQVFTVGVGLCLLSRPTQWGITTRKKVLRLAGRPKKSSITNTGPLACSGKNGQLSQSPLFSG